MGPASQTTLKTTRPSNDVDGLSLARRPRIYLLNLQATAASGSAPEWRDSSPRRRGCSNAAAPSFGLPAFPVPVRAGRGRLEGFHLSTVQPPLLGSCSAASGSGTAGRDARKRQNDYRLCATSQRSSVLEYQYTPKRKSCQYPTSCSFCLAGISLG